MGGLHSAIRKKSRKKEKNSGAPKCLPRFLEVLRGTVEVLPEFFGGLRGS
jgi:hypothetical protein